MFQQVNIDANDVETMIKGCKVISPSITGGQKKVFPCIYNGNKLALKFVLLADSFDSLSKINKEAVNSTYSRIQREIKVMEEMQSDYFVELGQIVPNIVVFKRQLLFYYSEEWIDGISVKDYFSDPSKTDLKEVLNLCKHITMAIDELWSKNMVHRDIKPGNIVRRNDGKYILLDFGIAYEVYGESLTIAGGLPRTPFYCSPEHYDLLNKNKMDFRADLYCLGIVLYEALTGKHPFKTRNMSEDDCRIKLLNDDYIEPKLVVPSIPEEMNDIVCKLLKRRPHQRYRKCQFLLDDIADLESKLGV